MVVGSLSEVGVLEFAGAAGRRGDLHSGYPAWKVRAKNGGSECGVIDLPHDTLFPGRLINSISNSRV